MIRELRLTRWQRKKRISGPYVFVYSDKIVAVEQFDNDDARGKWRTKLHLVGGGTLNVCEDLDTIRELLEQT
jgi:hypothetical protein